MRKENTIITQTQGNKPPPHATIPRPHFSHRHKQLHLTSPLAVFQALATEPLMVCLDGLGLGERAFSLIGRVGLYRIH